MLRGHLEISGITTVDDLAGRHHVHHRARARRSRLPRAERLRPPGALPTRSGRHRVGVASAARAHALLLTPHPPGRGRAGHRARLHALPVALAARRPRHAAHRRGRAAHRGRAAPGLRRCRGGLGARPARRPAAPLRARRGSTGSATTARSAWLRLNPPATRRRRARGRAVEGHADLGGRTRRPPVAAHGRTGRRRSRRTGASARPPRCSRCCASAARASPPSSARPPTGCPKTSSAPCGTAWPAAW